MVVVRKGLFITIDGVDGAGKTTQVKLLARRFKRSGKKYKVVREPGTARASEKIRKILLEPGLSILPESETLLYMASRVQLLGEVITPLLEEGYIVISDRYLGSTICYQGSGLGLGITKIIKMWKLINRFKEPDINFILDLPVADSLKRTDRNDRISSRKLDYFRKVSSCFRRLSKDFPRKYRLIDANRDINNISDVIWKDVKMYL